MDNYMEILKEHVPVLKRAFEGRFKTYLTFDQKANRRFDNDEKYWEDVKKDASKMADIVIEELESLQLISNKKPNAKN